MSYRNVVFAGGGSRCFWQLGFFDGAKDEGFDLHAAAEVVGATSARSAMAIVSILGRTDRALEIFTRLTDENPANVHYWNLRPGARRPVLPHLEMYRGAMEEFLGPGDLEAIHDADLRLLMSEPPRYAPERLAAVLGLGAYSLEKAVRAPLHPDYARRLGFRPIVGRARDCRTKEELIAMVLAASCVPPVLPGGTYLGRVVLDGGLLDNIPVVLVEDEPGDTLALLSKRHGEPLRGRAGVDYAQPREPIAIDKFDYANPAGVRETYAQGVRDGVAFARQRGVASVA